MIGLLVLLIMVFAPIPQDAPVQTAEVAPLIHLPLGVTLPGRIAFLSQRQLHIHDFISNTTTRVHSSERFLRPLWSPDGASLAYSGDGISLLDVARQQTRLLVPQNRRQPLGGSAWHPDGQHFFYSQSGVGMLAFDLTTGQSQLVLPPPWSGAWAPDGHTITLSREVPSANSGTRFDPVHLFTLDVRTCRDVAGRYDPDVCAANVVQLTFDGYINSNAKFSPDMSLMLYFHEREPLSADTHLILRDVATGQQRVLTITSRGFIHFNWGPDNRWLIVSGATYEQTFNENLFLIEVPTGAVTQITTQGGTMPSWWWPGLHPERAPNTPEGQP